MAIYTCLGEESPQTRYRAYLQKAASTGRSFSWSVAATAMPGDTGLFYLTGPAAREFIAYGQIDSPPKLDRRDNRHHARIVDLTMLQRPVPRNTVLARLAWGWLQQPRRSSRVPDAIEPALMKLLNAPALSEAQQAQSAMENIRTEQVLLRRSRHRGLRDACITRSHGVCAVCHTDFGTLVPDAWRRVLQAHHKRPLASLPNNVASKVGDLVALCPTCHVLAHLRRPVPLSVHVLRRQFAAGKVSIPAS